MQSFVREAIEKQSENDDVFQELANIWQQNLSSNLEQMEALLNKRAEFSLLNWEEIRPLMLEHWGAGLLRRTLQEDEIEMRIRAGTEPTTLHRRSDIEIATENVRKRVAEAKQKEKLQRQKQEEREIPKDTMLIEADQKDQQRAEEIFAHLSSESHSLSSEEQWMMKHCEEAVRNELVNIVSSFRNATTEELTALARSYITPLISASRRFIEEKIRANQVYGEEWHPLMLEAAVQLLGERMSLERKEPEETKAFLDKLWEAFMTVDGSVNASVHRREYLMNDAVLGQIPNLMEMPEMNELVFAGDEEYKEAQKQLKTRVGLNLEMLDRILKEETEDPDMQTQIKGAVLRENGRLIMWRRCTAAALREMVRAQQNG